MNTFFKGKPYSENRLFCLDMLRGLDMFLLTVIGPVFWGFQKAWPDFVSNGVVRQFRHGWEGFTLWDIIMPLFIFMCGAAIPFALPKRLENGRATWSYWRHVLGRVALLWFCGMLVQGNICTLDAMKISIFSNTLQSIAVGYLLAAAIMLIPSRKVRISIPLVLTAVYGLMLHFGGDYTPQHNFTVGFDRAVFSFFLPAGNSSITSLANENAKTIYTWILPSFMFVVMTLCGFHATEILRSHLTPNKKLMALGAYGVGMELSGWVLSLVIPVIKPIYTISFTFQAMGWCIISLAFLYLITDIFQIRRGFGIFILFGQYALTAYLVSHAPFSPALQALASSLGCGLSRIFGAAAQPFTLSLVTAICLIFALLVRRAIKPR